MINKISGHYHKQFFRRKRTIIGVNLYTRHTNISDKKKVNQY